MLANVIPIDESRRMIRVLGIPRPKPRMTHKDRYAPSKSVRDYRVWADMIRIHWRNAFKDDPWLGPISLGCIFEFPIPESWAKKKKELALAGVTAHSSPPDLDNLVKGVADALNKIAWRDDCQIVTYGDPTIKLWAPPGDAGAWIMVEKFEEQVS